MKTETKKSSKTSSQTSTKRSRRNAFRSERSNSQRTNGSSDIYEKFTDLIIEKLEQGIIPWRQPWSDYGMPANYLTKKPYR